jgi:hypothetical protein
VIQNPENIKIAISGEECTKKLTLMSMIIAFGWVGGDGIELANDFVRPHDG